MITWWLSFIDTERPVGQKFLGVCIIEANSPDEAIAKAWDHGCNPGGEAAVMNMEPRNEEGEKILAATPRNKLLGKAELEALGYKLASQAELQRQMPHATIQERGFNDRLH